MKKQFSAWRLAALAIAFLGLAPFGSAHERDTFKIGDKYYLLTVGSLNEPFIVDNISGVDFRASQVAGPAANGTSTEKGNGTPVTGLEQTLKVELIAGDKKETLSLQPSHSAPGSYVANFIPTVQTTYSYRIFGTMDSTSIDLIFTCVTGAISGAAGDSAQLKVSDAVTRLDKIGVFECPAARRTMGFPEPALSSFEVNQRMQNLETAARAAGQRASIAQAMGIIGFITGLSGLAVARMVWKRK